MKLLDEFKAFIMKGNVVDLAVGVMIGAAFGTIVKAFTDGIVTPLLGMLGGKPDVSLHAGPFDIGMVINAALGFLITAGIIFFFIVKPMAIAMAMAKKKEAAAPPPAPPADVQLLTEIRDLLKK
jgi:large conductance mechanosensitive channel